MDENEIFGSIPEKFCMLSDLKVLSMKSNRLEGTMPECIGTQMTRLTTVDLSDNSLQNIPDSIYNLRFLRVLDLSQNEIAGTISNELLPNLKSLTVANLASNQISGPIPASFDMLPDLSIMYLDNK